MLIINSQSHNPYFNLASEEYFLKNSNENILLFYRNAPSVIVGRNQNTLAEVNLSYIEENEIPVVRRLSGGGAVFHDLGNLNFSFIQRNDQDSFSNFQKFTQPVIEVLHKLKVNAAFSGRNDLTIDGKKFSGNAQFQDKTRMLHHGTLLFASEIQDMSKCLQPRKEKLENKGVKSVQSRVTNISSHLDSELSISEFEHLLVKEVVEGEKECQVYALTPSDVSNIDELVKSKYGIWKWNFGHSPKHNFSNVFKYPGGLVEIYLEGNQGLINNVRFCGDFFGKKDVKELEKCLKGIKHEKSEILSVLNSLDLNDYFMGLDSETLASRMLDF